MGNWIKEGQGAVVLDEAARTAETFSEEFYFADPGQGEVIIEVTAVGGPPGQITGVIVQNKVAQTFSNSDFVDSFNLGPQVINAVGKTVLTANDLMPTQGRLKITHADANSITYKVKLRNLGR